MAANNLVKKTLGNFFAITRHLVKSSLQFVSMTML